MQVGVVLISGAMVALSTWGYLATFATSPGSVSGRTYTPLLPVTWVDSRRANPHGKLETPLGFLDGRPPVAPKQAPPIITLALKVPPKIVRNGSRTVVPLPVRGVTMMAAVPLPERSMRTQMAMAAPLLPVRRPQQDLPASRVAESPGFERVRIARDVVAASMAAPAAVIVQGVVRQAASRPTLGLVTGSIERRADFEGRSALGGPLPVEIEPVSAVSSRVVGPSQPRAELPGLIPVRVSLNGVDADTLPAASAAQAHQLAVTVAPRSSLPALAMASESAEGEAGAREIQAEPVADRGERRAAPPRRRAAARKAHRPGNYRQYQQRRNRVIADSIRRERRARGVY